ncbi:MAG TPA: hypothetical protein VG077_19530 [Verrucomicrobiae bacterium]|nr:hypothetical protein [Verrucomicrobiae bacterium]
MSESFFDQAKDAVLKKFLKNRQRELDDFIARELADDQITARFRRLKDAVARQEALLSGLRQSCELYQGVSIATTIYEAAKRNADGPAKLSNIASEILPALVLNEHAAEIIGLAEKEFRAISDDLEVFKRSNAGTLKRLALL